MRARIQCYGNGADRPGMGLGDELSAMSSDDRVSPTEIRWSSDWGLRCGRYFFFAGLFPSLDRGAGCQ